MTWSEPLRKPYFPNPVRKTISQSSTASAGEGAVKKTPCKRIKPPFLLSLALFSLFISLCLSALYVYSFPLLIDLLPSYLVRCTFWLFSSPVSSSLSASRLPAVDAQHIRHHSMPVMVKSHHLCFIRFIQRNGSYTG